MEFRAEREALLNFNQIESHIPLKIATLVSIRCAASLRSDIASSMGQ